MRAPLRLLFRGLGALVLPAVVTLLYTQATACGAPCSGPDRVFDQGILKMTAAGAYWATSPIDGPFLPFEGNATYHLHHTLGVRPDHVAIYLSFSDRPETVGNGGSAPSAGNLALVLHTSSDEIIVKSDTCASYYIRVEAFAYGDEADASFSDVGSDAGADVTIDATETDASAD